MPRSLLISLKDGRGFKTYGVKKVQTSMKFSFIICFVIALARCECVEADSRIFNDLKYLEYLNDLDRRNVEMDDIHGQWPFHQITADREDEDRNEPDESNPDPENLMKIEEFVNLARAEMVNRHHQNYRDSLLDRIEKGYKHLKDTSDRANQLSQYLRYKTPSDIEEILEDVRMYPQENDFTFKEEDVKDLEDNNFFQNANDFIIDDEQEATDEIEPQSSETFYAKPIKPVERSTVNTLDTNEEPVINNAMHHHDHDDYQFKEGEEFSDLIEFNKIPMADDPREFGVGPSDPRYYRDSENEEPKTITALPKLIKSKEADPPRPHPTAKVKLSARTDALQQAEHIPVYHDLIRGSFDKDVKVVPFKPDEQTDTAGVYIIAVVAGISAAATVGLIAVGIGWYKFTSTLQRSLS